MVSSSLSINRHDCLMSSTNTKQLIALIYSINTPIMFHVEVIPNSSSSHVTPGWTYVADKGFDSAKAAIAPTTGRKRGIRDPARTDVSSRQANAIARHLAELDRENHRDISIAIPARKDAQPRESATRGKQAGLSYMRGTSAQPCLNLRASHLRSSAKSICMVYGG